MIIASLNFNIIKNIKYYYYTLDFTIKYILIIFNQIFKVNFNNFSKKFAFIVLINIFLKYISSNLTIYFIIQNNF